MGTPFYRLQKSTRWKPTQQLWLPLGRLPTVRFLIVGPAVDRPVDRGLDTESRALCRSTAQSTKAIFREQNSLAVDRAVDRPNLCTSVHIGRPERSSDFLSGRPKKVSPGNYGD